MVQNLDTLFSIGLQGLFYLITLIFVIYSLCVVYHWFTYGSSKRLSMLSLAVYLGGSAPLFIIMAVALSLI